MNINENLQNEMTPAEVVSLQYRQTVSQLANRVPQLVEQYSEAPEELAALAEQIEKLEPLPLVPELATETLYPTEALTGMDGAVYEIANRLKVPAALVGQCALGQANSIIQGLVDIQKPANPRPKPSSLFFLTGAASGEGKTLVDDILSSRLSEQCLQTDLNYQEQHRDYDIALKAYHCEQKKVETQKDIGQTQREQALKALEQPMPPMNPRLKASDVTIEGIARQFREGCTRLSIATDEGSLLFGNHALVNDRRTAVMGRLCKLWDGGQWDVDRGASENNFSLTGRRLSMSISTQPDILKGVMSDTLAQNQGFLPRFLVAMPDSRIHERQMIDIEWSSLQPVQEYWQRLARLYDIVPATRMDSPLILNPRVLSMNPAALKEYRRFGNQCFRDCSGVYEPIRAMALKAEDNLLRLAATLAIWNNPAAGTISAEDTEAATYIMRYYLNEGLKIADFASAGSDDSDLSLAAELLSWLKASGRYLVHSRVMTQKAPKRNMRKAEKIKRLMDLLMEYGHAVRLDGRPFIDGKPRKDAWLITS